MITLAAMDISNLLKKVKNIIISSTIHTHLSQSHRTMAIRSKKVSHNMAMDTNLSQSHRITAIESKRLSHNMDTATKTTIMRLIPMFGLTTTRILKVSIFHKILTRSTLHTILTPSTIRISAMRTISLSATVQAQNQAIMSPNTMSKIYSITLHYWKIRLKNLPGRMRNWNGH